MKRKFFVFLLATLAISLTGCSFQKKSDITTSNANSNQISQEAAGASAVPEATGSGTSTTGALVQDSAGSVLDLNFDSDTIDDTFNQSYQEAYSDANSTLKGQAKFCNVMVEMSPTQNPATAKLNFFFTTDSQKDWYWLNQKDLLENIKKRMFAAKRDFSEISCVSTTVNSISVNYADALKEAVDSGGASLNSTDIAKIKIYLEGTNWKIDGWKNDSTIASQSVPFSSTAAASTSSSSSSTKSTTK